MEADNAKRGRRAGEVKKLTEIRLSVISVLSLLFGITSVVYALRYCSYSFGARKLVLVLAFMIISMVGAIASGIFNSRNKPEVE